MSAITLLTSLILQGHEVVITVELLGPESKIQVQYLRMLVDTIRKRVYPTDFQITRFQGIP